MKDQDKTRAELVAELQEMREKIAELETSLVTFKQQEEVGQEAETKFKAMIEAFDGFIYMCSPLYEVKFMNERFIQRIGHNPLGKKCYRAVHDRDEICPWCVNEKVLLGETVRWEFRSRKDGRWFKVVNSPVRHRDGTISKMSLIQDITERKRSENVLLARLRLVQYSASHSLDELLQTTLDEVEALTDSSIGFYHFIEPDQRTLRLQAWSTRTLREMCTAEGSGLHYDIDEAGVWADCVRERKPVIHNDYSALPPRKGMPVGHADVTRELVVPVFRDDRIVAILGVGNKAVDYDASDIETVSLMADLSWDIAERKQAEQERLENLRFFETMDRVNRAIQGTNDLEQMMRDVLDIVLSVFDCDRAFLTYPCDPQAASWTAPMEGTKPEYPGVLALGLEMPMDAEVAHTMQAFLDSKGPVKSGPGADHPVPTSIAKRFGVKSSMVTAIYPRLGKPWHFGIHQCSHPRVWTQEEERLFQETGRRLEDALNALLAHRNLRDNMGKLEEAQRIGHIGYWDCDIAGNQVTLAEETCRILGISEQESVFNLEQWHERQLSLLHPEDRQRVDQAYVEALATSARYNEEYRIVRADGEVRYIHSEANVTRDESGHAIRMLGMMQDITEYKRAQEAVNRANEDWKQTFDAIPDMVTVLDTEHRIVRANKATADCLGMTEQELIGRHCYKLVHGESKPPVSCPHSQLIADGLEHFAETTEPRLGATFEVRVSPIRSQDGQIRGAVHVARDITERKQAETELRKSNDLLRAIIETAPTAIIGLDLDGNVQIVWNPAAEKMLGWSAQEVMGRPLPSVPAQKQEEFRGFRERIRRGKTLDGVEVRRQRRDGSPIDCSIYASPLHDAEGRITGNICVLVDMTDRKRAEQALLASEEKYRTLFIESIDGVYSVLRDGQITDANASFCDIFGYTRQEMIGKDVLELYVNPADRQRFQKEIERRGFVKDYEVKLRKRDGTEVDCLLSSSVHFGADGSIAGYRGILRDLTLHKALQRQLLQAQKMESIGNLAGGIAHDFNNLLQVIIGYSDMLLFHKKPSDREYEGLHAIRQAGRHGAELAKRILAFSRRLEPDARPVNLNNEIVRVQKMLERTVSKMIRIEILLADNLMAVNADPSQMEQILLNLVVNAQHAMPDGGRLTIETANVTLDEHYSRTHLDVEPGRYVLLSVSDTGHGMDKEVLEHIFEPFYTTKEAGEGTGLGLAMVFGIVKTHKGHIICFSEPGAGTTFKIYLPVIVQEIEQDVAATQQMPAFGNETILLVDDEESIRKLVEEMLTMAGYTVLTATNGREALEIYRSQQNRIDLVLLDLMMPEMGGKQCVEELFKINGRVKVIIASGYSANGPTKDTLTAEAKGFVNKPYDLRQVRKVVRKVLDAE